MITESNATIGEIQAAPAQPKILLRPIGVSGEPGTDYTSSIPYGVADGSDTTFSLQFAFPTLIQVDPTSGGSYVTRQDMNGFIYYVTTIISYMQQGYAIAPFTSNFDNGTTSTATFPGYQTNAMVTYTLPTNSGYAGLGICYSAGDNNTTAPTGVLNQTSSWRNIVFDSFNQINQTTYLAGDVSFNYTTNKLSLNTQTPVVPVATNMLLGTTGTVNQSQSIALGSGVSLNNNTLNISTFIPTQFSKTTSGAYTVPVPVGARVCIFTLIGGGGSGSGATATTGGTGGSGGGSYYRNYLDISAGGTITGSIGAGGAGVQGGTQTGNNGGNSTLIYNSNTITAGGGGGGVITPDAGIYTMTAGGTGQIVGEPGGVPTDRTGAAQYAGGNGGGTVLGRGGRAFFAQANLSATTPTTATLGGGGGGRDTNPSPGTSYSESGAAGAIFIEFY